MTPQRKETIMHNKYIVIDMKLARFIALVAITLVTVMFITIQIQSATIATHKENYKLLLEYCEAKDETIELQSEMVGILETKLQNLGGNVTTGTAW